MEDSTKKKLNAALKMGKGAGSIAGGLAALAGHGALATMAKRGGAASYVAGRGVMDKLERGWEGVQEGFDDFRKS